LNSPKCRGDRVGFQVEPVDGVILRGKKVIAAFEPKPFADVFERIGVGPADADGFFGQRDGLLVLGVDGLFGLDPGNLVGHEMLGQPRGGVESVEGMQDVHNFFNHG